MIQRGRYSFLFNYDITDYKKWAYGLKKAGYATNPKYPQLLIKIIEKYDLEKYDKEALGKHWKKSLKNEKKQVEASAIAYSGPVISNLKTVSTTDRGRKVLLNNKKKLILAKTGDTYESIAAEFDIYSWQLYKYNEVDKKHKLVLGEMVYLEKKHKKAAKQYKIHVVREGESLHDIAQIYGMRYSKLLKLNNLPHGISVPVGKKLKLR